MIKRVALAVVGWLCFVCVAVAGLPIVDSQNQPLPTLAPMLERAVPAVVNIVTTTRVPVQQNPLLSDPFFRYFFDLPQMQPKEQKSQSLGSGVVIDRKKGWVITNNHVVKSATEIAVNLADGTVLQAKLVGADEETDIALLQVEHKKLTELPLADSDKLRVGDFVVAIGNPFGLGQTVTSGIVSALGRSGLGIEGYEDFIQTDASINPGNSGGALVNLRGELVGINTAILSKSGGNVGIGFAIPTNMAQEIVDQLAKYGEVKRGQLGINAQNITADLADAFGIEQGSGVVITQITKGSSADKAGLRTGDLILRINGRTVRDATDIRNRVGLLRVGQKVLLSVQSRGKLRDVTLVIGEPELVNIAGEKLHTKLTGAILQQNAEMTSQGEIAYVSVGSVESGSAAHRAGLRAGDIIVQANRRAVSTLQGLQQAVTGSRALLLNIQRGSEAFFLLIQ